MDNQNKNSNSKKPFRLNSNPEHYIASGRKMCLLVIGMGLVVILVVAITELFKK
jgi:hypothetical protein